MKENYNFKRILIPVDFSERSANAVKQAAHIAKEKGAQLILFHAFSRPDPGQEKERFQIEKELAQKTEKIEMKFLEFTDAIPELRECNFQRHTSVGISLPSIENAFKSLDIDLMIVATHGAKGIELIWGSKTTNLIADLKGPILVLPDETNLSGIKKICLAYDFHKPEQNIYALSVMKELALLFNAHVRILDVRPRNLPKSENHLLEEKKIISYLGEEVSHDFESVYSRDIEHSIEKYVKDYNIDLLAMIPGEYNFFEQLFHQSLTETLAGKLDIPLLSLADK